MNLEAGQIRAARALLGWSQQQLSDRTGLSLRTIRRAEDGGKTSAAVEFTIRRTLEDEGIVFVFSPASLEECDTALGAVLGRKRAKSPHRVDARVDRTGEE